MNILTAMSVNRCHRFRDAQLSRHVQVQAIQQETSVVNIKAKKSRMRWRVRRRMNSSGFKRTGNTTLGSRENWNGERRGVVESKMERTS